MRIGRRVIGVLAMGILIGTATLASAKTVEVGDVSTSWIGTGELHDLPDEGQVIHATVKGALIVRHFKGENEKKHVHTAELICSIRVTMNVKQNQRGQIGLCTVFAHAGKDVGYGQWKCDGGLNECEGEFTWTHGTGGWTGISGTTPMFNRIVFEKIEGERARAVGYASWPNLTYTLP
ncbi:MAG: hypothetical protein QM706_14090 [Nitrospira sp.]